MTPIGAMPSLIACSRIVAPSCDRLRLKAAPFSLSIDGIDAPSICSTALNAPSGAGVAVVPPEPCTLSAMHCTVPSSNGAAARRTGGVTPGSAFKRPMMRDSSWPVSFSVVLNMTNPPPFLATSTLAALYFRNENSARSSLSLRLASDTGPGRYQN